MTRLLSGLRNIGVQSRLLAIVEQFSPCTGTRRGHQGCIGPAFRNLGCGAQVGRGFHRNDGTPMLNSDTRLIRGPVGRRVIARKSRGRAGAPLMTQPDLID